MTHFSILPDGRWVGVLHGEWEWEWEWEWGWAGDGTHGHGAIPVGEDFIIPGVGIHGHGAAPTGAVTTRATCMDSMMAFTDLSFMDTHQVMGAATTTMVPATDHRAFLQYAMKKVLRTSWKCATME